MRTVLVKFVLLFLLIISQINFLFSREVNLYTGDLNLNIPLMNVPGRGGLNVPINLTYKSGVKNSDQSSWVGLGFGLNLGVITRIVNHWGYEYIEDDYGNMELAEFKFLPDEQPDGWLSAQQFEDQNQDTYVVSFIGGGGRIFFSGINVEENDELAMGGSIIKQKAVLANYGDWDIDYEITNYKIISWRITTSDGTVYVFDQAASKDATITYLRKHYDTGGGSCSQINQLCVDTGFDPCEQYVLFENGEQSHSITDVAYSWYLTEILSADYIDLTGNGPSDDDKGNWIKINYTSPYPSKINYRVPYDKDYNLIYLHHLDEWDNYWNLTHYVRLYQHLYSKEVGSQDIYYIETVETPTHKAFFNISQRLDFLESNGTRYPYRLDSIELKEKYSNTRVSKLTFNYDYSLCTGAPGSSSGKLTLQSITQNGKTDTDYLPPTKFYYASNPNYGADNYDWWDYYNTSSINDDGYAGDEAKAWSLTKVLNSTGGETEYSYEPKKFQCYHDNCFAGSAKMGGGIRVNKISVKSGITGDLYETNYIYGDGVTEAYENDNIDFSILNNLMLCSYTAGETYNKLFYNVGHSIGYKDIIVDSPGENGATKYSFYTAVDAGHSNIDDGRTNMAFKRGKMKSIISVNQADFLADDWTNPVSEKTFSYSWKIKDYAYRRDLIPDVAAENDYFIYSGQTIITANTAKLDNVETTKTIDYVSINSPGVGTNYNFKNLIRDVSATNTDGTIKKSQTVYEFENNMLNDNTYSESFLDLNDWTLPSPDPDVYDITCDGSSLIVKMKAHPSKGAIITLWSSYQSIQPNTPYFLVIQFASIYGNSNKNDLFSAKISYDNLEKQILLNTGYNATPHQPLGPVINDGYYHAYFITPANINEFHIGLTFGIMNGEADDFQYRINELRLHKLENDFLMKNLVSLTSSNEIYEDGNIIRHSETIWSDFDSDPNIERYYPQSTKVWLDDGDGIFEGDSETPPAGLITKMTFDKYDSHGNQLQSTNSRGVASTVIYGNNNTVPIATVANAKAGECSYTSLESGWDNGWTTGGSTISSQTSFTGDCSAYCISDASNNDWGPTKDHAYEDIDVNKAYIADAWVYVVSGQAMLKISVREGETPRDGVYEFSDSSIDGWQQIQVEIPPDKLSGMGAGWCLRVWCGFPYTGNEGYVDDVRFYPKGSLMTTKTYNPVTMQVTSESDIINIPVINKFDDLHRPYEIINKDGKILKRFDYYYSREAAPQFDPLRPNNSKTVIAPSDGTIEPIVSIAYSDGLGRSIQSQTKDGDYCLITKSEYNDVGKVQKQYITRKVLNPQLSYLTHEEKTSWNFGDGTDEIQSNTIYDANQAIQTVSGTTNNINNGSVEFRAGTEIVLKPGFSVSNGATFRALVKPAQENWLHEQFDYISDPLTRLDTQTHADGTELEYRYGSDYNLIAGQKHQYTEFENENNDMFRSYFDKLGNNVGGFGDCMQTPTLFAYATKWQHIPDVLGNVAETHPPNHYSNRYVENYDYDSNNIYNTLGQLIEDTSPDEGITSYKYDNLGNMRFIQSAEQATTGYFTVYRYDKLNRIISVGIERSISWSSADPNSDNCANSSSSWLSQHLYDDNYVTGVENNCYGQLTCTKVYNDLDASPHEVIYEMKYVYNENGQLAEKHVINHQNPAIADKILKYEFDFLGRETKTTYPSGNVVMKYYDHLGRLKKVVGMQ